MNLLKSDSAGLIYPYVKSKDRASVFRMEAELDSDINVELLEKAVADISKRFPTFFVKLVVENRMYMLGKVDEHNIVCEEKDNICTTFDFDNQIPLRITVYKNRVGMEIFHMIADGHGALVFFKSLLSHYCKLSGDGGEYDDETLDPTEKPDLEEEKDSFLDISKDGKKKVSRFGSYAYQYCPNEPFTNLNATQLKLNSDELKVLAKKYNTTVGIFLISVYMYAFYCLKSRKSKRPIKISVPADLRRLFPSKTLRNFSLYAIVGISPRKCKWTLEKIIEAVSVQLPKQLDKQNMLNMAYTNVSSSNTKFFELLPMWVKKLALRFGFDYLGEKLFTSAFSNLGVVKLPDNLKRHIKEIRWFIGEAVVNQINVTAISFDGNTNLIFTSRVENDELQRTFASILRDSGVEVKHIIKKNGQKEYVEV